MTKMNEEIDDDLPPEETEVEKVVEEPELEKAEDPEIEEPDPRDTELEQLRERNAQLERMTRGGGYREVERAPNVDPLELTAVERAALMQSDDPRDQALLKLAERTEVAEHKLAMIEEAEELGASPAEIAKMRRLVNSRHAGSMSAAKLMVEALEAREAKKRGVAPKAREKEPLPPTVDNPKKPASREVIAEAARRAAELRRSPGATGGARTPEGQFVGAPPPEGEGEAEGSPRVITAEQWNRYLAGPNGRQWLRAQRAGKVRVDH